MRATGLRGAVRGKAVRTTIQDPAAPCPLDRVRRQFHAPSPDRLWVSDFTHLATRAGASPTSRSPSSSDRWRTRLAHRRLRATHRGPGGSAAAPRRASCSTRSSRRSTSAGPRRAQASSHTRTAGRPCLAIRYTERLAGAGIAPSVGSVGGSFDNALAETVIGLFKTEVIRRRGPLAQPRGGGARHPRTEGPRAAANGCTGSTIAGSSARSGTSRPPRPRRASTASWRTPPWRRRTPNEIASGKAGAVHVVGSNVAGNAPQDEEVRQHVDDVRRPEPAVDPDRQASSWVNSSMTLSMRNLRPSWVRSSTKS